jgi:hypothetical protein
LDGGGSSGRAGSGGGGIAGNGRLGAACASDADCDTNLTCITSASTALDGAGAPRGLCTASCADGGAATCESLESGAVCLNFGTDIAPALYCVQGCQFGPVGSGTFNPNKCHGREEVACAALFGPTGTRCASEQDCLPGELCDGECYQVIPGCLPQCNADSDCGDRFCDPATGLCMGSPKAGLLLGDECTQPPAGGVDPCRGTCIGLVGTAGGTPTDFVCGENCTIGTVASCGWEGPASRTPAPGFCLLSSTIVGEHGGPGSGDRGTCAQLCNCNADCRHASFVCISLDNADFARATQRQGFCTLPEGEPGIPCP